jgi:hypothetical protein
MGNNSKLEEDTVLQSAVGRTLEPSQQCWRCIPAAFFLRSEICLSEQEISLDGKLSLDRKELRYNLYCSIGWQAKDMN